MFLILYSSCFCRSAAFLLRYVVSGLREKLLFMPDGGTYLRTAYRALKLSVYDKDSVVKYHSEVALGELDKMMREQLFFSESQLKGENTPKIRIL